MTVAIERQAQGVSDHGNGLAKKHLAAKNGEVVGGGDQALAKVVETFGANKNGPQQVLGCGVLETETLVVCGDAIELVEVPHDVKLSKRCEVGAFAGALQD
jgi:hypothetical protein